MTWHSDRFIQRAESAEMILRIPDIRQTTPHGCGEAALQAVLSFHGITAAIRFATATDGSDPRQIEAALRRLGLGVTSGEMTVADLGHYCAEERPVIVLVTWSGSASSHWVVVRGVTSRFVHYFDPIGGNGKETLSEFHSAWYAAGRLGEAYRCWGISPVVH